MSELSLLINVHSFCLFLNRVNAIFFSILFDRAYSRDFAFVHRNNVCRAVYPVTPAAEQ